ncbi:ATP-binding protein [Mycobacterium sp. 1423905.2]|uniref:ATP-binding protein n=1 Tax=Mycobacterium sp. 1423905.2 TaxID=1856859 RepID=UPI0007FD1143|nr:ATP-binding protein [Mycobacterium sp. 1423905.2]OBJ53112.1 kinase [Mycobacterium sp. 1423905.2]
MAEVAILIGLQAAGKTTFYRQRLAATHVHVSKDNFRHNRNRQRRQMQLITDALAAGRDVAVDNTNPSSLEWEPIVDLAHACGAPVVAYWFPPDVTASLRRNVNRSGHARVSEIAILSTVKRLRPPRPEDGFDRLVEVSFDGAGGFRLAPLDMRTQ